MKSSEIKVHFETCFVLPNSEQKNNVFSASASGKISWVKWKHRHRGKQIWDIKLK